MRFLEFFRLNRRPATSAAMAKQRLQVVVALDRPGTQGPDFLPLLKRDLIDAIRKYVAIDDNRLSVELERGDGMSVLSFSVEVPAGLAARRQAV